jgi:hypothetical protein
LADRCNQGRVIFHSDNFSPASAAALPIILRSSFDIRTVTTDACRIPLGSFGRPGFLFPAAMPEE